MNLDNIQKGKFIPKNIHKYLGDVNDITYRSSWERFVMYWADINPSIEYWGSEITTIKYVCGTDGKIHTYYIDFTFKFTTGRVLLVEIKPKSQTKKPTPTKGKSKKTVLSEHLAYTKNVSKWKYAVQYAKANKIDFEIWTEDSLKKIGFNQI